MSDARNPLASVARRTERWRIAPFGRKDEDNHIFNPKTGEKVMMRRKGPMFVLDADQRQPPVDPDQVRERDTWQSHFKWQGIHDDENNV